MYTAKARIAPGRRVVILEPWYAAHFRTRQTDRHGGDGAVEILARPRDCGGTISCPGSCMQWLVFGAGLKVSPRMTAPTN